MIFFVMHERALVVIGRTSRTITLIELLPSIRYVSDVFLMSEFDIDFAPLSLIELE